MATGQGILERLRKAKAGEEEIRGVLPLVAFYGREPERERARNRMYHDIAMQVMTQERASRFMYFGVGEKVTVVDTLSSPLEFLASRGELESDLDQVGMGGARFHTALRFRDLMEGAQVKGLKSPSLEGNGGGGGTSAGDIRSYQLDCIKILKRLKDKIAAAWAFDLVEGIVWRDDWFDLHPEATASQRRQRAMLRDRTATVTALHFALDSAGVVLHYIPEEDFKQRWADQTPALPPVIRRRIRASMAPSRLALQT